MLKIRLQRIGRVHEPSFRLVLTDSKNSTKSGKFKEILGSYDPRKSIDSINGERVKHWLSKGAQATDTVHNLLITHGVIEGKKRNVLPKKTYNPQPTTDEGTESAKVEEVAEEPATEEVVDVPAENTEKDVKIEETVDKAV